MTTTTNKWYYTQEEIEVIKSIKPEWGKMGKQFKRVAQELGRSPQAIQYQYHILNRGTEQKPVVSEPVKQKQSSIDDALNTINAYVHDTEQENQRLRKQLAELQAEFDQVLGIINKARQIQTGVGAVGSSSVTLRQNKDGSFDTV